MEFQYLSNKKFDLLNFSRYKIKNCSIFGAFYMIPFISRDFLSKIESFIHFCLQILNSERMLYKPKGLFSAFLKNSIFSEK